MILFSFLNIFVVIQLIFVFNILNAVKIEKLVVPELVQMDNVSEIMIDCQLSDILDEQYTLRWFFKGNEVPIYQWTPRSIPSIGGVLEGRLNLTYDASPVNNDKHPALRIVRLSPELSGEYTCSIERNGTELRETKHMLIFSPEQDFDLKISQQDHVFNIICTVRGVFPSPDLTLEYQSEQIVQQEQRVWRSGAGAAYDAESAARVPAAARARGPVACRLALPEAGYIAIREKLLHAGDQCSNSDTVNNITLLKLNVLLPIITIIVNERK